MDTNDTFELENHVGNAVDALLDISRQLEKLTTEVEKISRKVRAIEEKLR